MIESGQDLAEDRQTFLLGALGLGRILEVPVETQTTRTRIGRSLRG